MNTCLFEMFKMEIGPSSSHPVARWVGAGRVAACWCLFEAEKRSIHAGRLKELKQADRRNRQCSYGFDASC